MRLLLVALMLAALALPSSAQTLEQLKQQAGPVAPAPAIPKVETVPPAAKNPSLLQATVEHACYDALQAIGFASIERAYFHHPKIVKVVRDITATFGKEADGCDISQPLFNFHSLAPGVYRSGKPTAEGMDRLKALGVKTVLYLAPDKPFGSNPTEASVVASKGMTSEDIPMDWTAWPPYEQLDEALKIIADPAKQPVDFHCTCGYDRTGMVAGAYRIVYQGWTPAQAAKEAKEYGQHLPMCGDLTGYLAGYLDHRKAAGLSK